jgi:RNA polymerase sigma-70 factor (ECF subfamily)
VLQETFVQAWRDARRFDAGRSSVRGWLFTIARSRALDRWRSRRSYDKRIHAADAPALERAAGESAGPPDIHVRDFVERALARLSVHEETVLRLAYFEGLTQEEIARRLNEPLGTVKSRTRSALVKIRTHAAEEEKKAGHG